ncbi:DUF4390 domain-containing protein [bacterium]|nr:DUF4390 domain-containing protein [bacterium]
MNKYIRILLFLSCGFCLRAWAAEKPVEFRNITVTDSVVSADILFKQLFRDDIVPRLRKGMTAAMEYQIQLWEQRGGWADRLVCEKYTRIKLSYDPWLKQYQLIAGSDDPRQMNEDSLRASCSILQDIGLAPEGGVRADSRYYIAARAVVHPMSVENVDEIRRWLSGEARELDPRSISLKDQPGRKASHWAVRFFLNITGFGDRVMSGKSGLFRREEE